jgi:hypothetical protein
MDTKGTGRIYHKLLQIDSIEIEYTHIEWEKP